MAWIKLRERGREIARLDLPHRLQGPDQSTFELRRAVREGGNGLVFEARHYSRDGNLLRTCAVKFLKERDETRIDRFQNEIRVLESLKSEKISEFYGSGSIQLERYEVPWMAMELGGRNLREYIQHAGPLDRDRLVPILSQILVAIKHVHDAGFIHRDVKPANFVFEENSKADIIMIDFGIAKRTEEDVSGRPLDNFTKHMEFVGPVFVSSPELIAYASDKSVDVDHRSDLFQFGKVAWFLATGRISAGVPSKKACPFDGRLWELVMALLADDPSDRPPSANEVLHLLEGVSA